MNLLFFHLLLNWVPHFVCQVPGGLFGRFFPNTSAILVLFAHLYNWSKGSCHTSLDSISDRASDTWTK